LPVPVNGARLPIKATADEDRHDPRLPKRILPWPVDIGISQGYVRELLLGKVVPQVHFPGHLGRAIWRDRPHRMGLGRRKDLLLAIASAARGGEHEAFDPSISCRL